MLCHWCVLVLSWLCIGFVMVVHYVIHSCRILNIDPNKHTAFATQHWDFPPLPSYSPLGVGDYDWVTHFLWISALVPRECNIPALEGKGGHFSRTQPLSSPSHHQNHTLVLEGTQQEVHSLLIISVKKIRILTDLVLSDISDGSWKDKKRIDTFGKIVIFGLILPCSYYINNTKHSSNMYVIVWIRHK